MFRSSVKVPPTQVLPGVNTLVKLAIVPPAGPAGRAGAPVVTGGPLGAVSPTGAAPATWMQLPSRIEDVDETPPGPGRRSLLYVAAPRYAGDLEGPEPGSPCRVTWPTPVGLCELPTRFQGRAFVGPALRAWRLVVDGPVMRAQRRRFFRVPWVGPVTLEVSGDLSQPQPQPQPRRVTGPDQDGSPAVAADLQVLTGMAMDLSEGGLRVTLPAPGLQDRTAIRVLLPVRDQVLVLPATTVWHRADPAPGRRQVETGISFDDTEEHGDLLRRVVVEAQLQARRAGLI
jgi:PilZ domain